MVLRHPLDTYNIADAASTNSTKKVTAVFLTGQNLQHQH